MTTKLIKIKTNLKHIQNTKLALVKTKRTKPEPKLKTTVGPVKFTYKICSYKA